MSKENVKLFFEKVQEDEELQQHLYRLTGEKREEHAEKTVEVAREYGYTFSKEDLGEIVIEKLSTVVERGELSEEELEAVTGGNYNIDSGKNNQNNNAFVVTGINTNNASTRNRMIYTYRRFAG